MCRVGPYPIVTCLPFLGTPVFDDTCKFVGAELDGGNRRLRSKPLPMVCLTVATLSDPSGTLAPRLSGALFKNTNQLKMYLALCYEYIEKHH
jgi:hypothetical protein